MAKRGRPPKKRAIEKVIKDPNKTAEYLTSKEVESQLRILEKVKEEYDNENVHEKLDFLNKEFKKITEEQSKTNKELKLAKSLKENVDYISKALKELPLEEVKEMDELYSRSEILKTKVREIQHKVKTLDSKVEEKHPSKYETKNIRNDLKEEVSLFEEDLMSRFKSFEADVRKEIQAIKGGMNDVHGGFKQHTADISEKSTNLNERLGHLESRLEHMNHAFNLFESDLRKRVAKLKKPELLAVETDPMLLERIEKIEHKQEQLSSDLNLEEVKVLDDQIHEISSKINSLRNTSLQNEDYIYSLRTDLKSLSSIVEKDIIFSSKNRPTIIH